MAAVVDADLRTLLADSLNGTATLTLEISKTIDGAAPVTDSETVTYDLAVQSTVSSYAEISADVTFTIGTLTEVQSVSLYDGTTLLASETLTTDNNFPNGGDLIVTSFKITVS